MENKEDRRIYTLSQEVPAKAVVKMSVPLIFGMFIMVLYNLVDWNCQEKCSRRIPKILDRQISGSVMRELLGSS